MHGSEDVYVVNFQSVCRRLSRRLHAEPFVFAISGNTCWREKKRQQQTQQTQQTATAHHDRPTRFRFFVFVQRLRRMGCEEIEGGRMPLLAQREQRVCQMGRGTHCRADGRLVVVSGANGTRSNGPTSATVGSKSGTKSAHAMYLSGGGV
jgi:hypothetical protein